MSLRLLNILILTLLIGCGSNGSDTPPTPPVPPYIPDSIEYTYNADTFCMENNNADYELTTYGNVETDWSTRILFWNCIDDQNILYFLSDSGKGCYTYDITLPNGTDCDAVAPTPFTDIRIDDFTAILNIGTDYSLTITNDSNVPMLIKYQKTLSADPYVKNSRKFIIDKGETVTEDWNEGLTVYGTFDITIDLMNFDGEVLDTMTKTFTF